MTDEVRARRGCRASKKNYVIEAYVAEMLMGNQRPCDRVVSSWETKGYKKEETQTRRRGVPTMDGGRETPVVISGRGMMGRGAGESPGVLRADPVYCLVVQSRTLRESQEGDGASEGGSGTQSSAETAV